MKLEFDSIEEMINFLRSQGYIVTVGDTTVDITPKVYM